MTFFRGQYRVESARLQGYDYATPGAYFVTICTKHRQYFFGNIENNQVQYAEAGAIAANIWKRIPEQFPYVELDEYIIMPNHVHGIIWLLPPNGTDAINPISADEHRAILPPSGRDAINRVSTADAHESRSAGMPLSQIIRWFKGRSTFEIRKSGLGNFAWQPRFYDHIIRNENSLSQIRIYVRQNPQDWLNDHLR
jgi:REP element-mobilizing transposase RayT